MLAHRYTLDAARWAALPVSDLDLGDVRRDARAVTIAAALAAQPSASRPQLFPRGSELKAAYTFFSQPRSTPDALQATHREQVQAVLQTPGVYLLPEDTSEVAWPNRTDIRGLGPVGASQDRPIGFLLHAVLAVRWPTLNPSAPPGPQPALEIIGLAEQSYHMRQPRPAAEARSQHHARLARARASEIWSQMTARLGLAPDDPAVRWVRVCDRGADIDGLKTTLNSSSVVRRPGMAMWCARRATASSGMRMGGGLGSCSASLNGKPPVPSLVWRCARVRNTRRAPRSYGSAPSAFGDARRNGPGTARASGRPGPVRSCMSGRSTRPSAPRRESGFCSATATAARPPPRSTVSGTMRPAGCAQNFIKP